MQLFLVLYYQWLHVYLHFPHLSSFSMHGWEWDFDFGLYQTLLLYLSLNFYIKGMLLKVHSNPWM